MKRSLALLALLPLLGSGDVGESRAPISRAFVVLRRPGTTEATFLCVRLRDGRTLWTHTWHHPNHRVHRCGDLAIVGGMGCDRVTAVDLSTGREQWVYSWTHADSVSKRDAVLVWDARELRCLEARTGALRWKADLVPVGRIESIGAHRLLMRTKERLLCLDAAGGRAVWETRDVAPVPEYCVWNERVYCVGGSLNTRVSCLDAWTGAKQWQTELAHEVTRLFAHGGRMYARSLAGHLSALEPANGKKSWEFRGRSDIGFFPVRGGALVVSQRSNTTLHMMDAQGAVRWQTRRDEMDAWAWVVDDRVLSLDSGWRKLHAYDVRTGTKIWQLGWNAYSAFPYLGRDAVYVLKAQEALACLEVRTGRERWVHTAVDPIRHVYPLGSWVIVVTADRIAYLSARDGSALWEIPLRPPVQGAAVAFVD